MSNSENRIIVVSGLPRSGTSLMMRMLDQGGLEPLTDGIRQSDEDNPRGYYEVEQVKGLKKQADKSWLGSARGKAIKIVSSLLRDLPAEYHYDVIFMNRDLDEVIASQNTMIARRGESVSSDDQQMRQLYVQHLGAIKAWMAKQPHFRIFEVSYNEVVQHPAREAQRVKAFLGLPLDVSKMSEAVDKQLYRNRRGLQSNRTS
jgi:hypothetical protein